MNTYNLVTDGFLLPTPAGAFYAASSPKKETARSFIFKLLSETTSFLLSNETLSELTGITNQQEGLELMFRMQTLGWLQIESAQRGAPEGMLVDLLPTFLPSLSNKALLADAQGFYLATHGFSHETAEELSALSADLAALHDRHRGLLQNNVGLSSSAWAIVDSAANGHLGFWPLHIGAHRFVLVLSGQPQFNHANFVKLIWALNKRYNET